MKNFSNPIFLFSGLLLVASSVFAQPVNVTYSHTDPIDPNGIIWAPPLVSIPGISPEIYFVANTNNVSVPNQFLIPTSSISSGMSVIRIFGKSYNKVIKISKTN